MSADAGPGRPAVRGRLRIYLGYAPGAGTTCALLSEGRRRAERGTDVVLASAETHGRPHTEDLLAGLEVIPAAKVPYRGTLAAEMDLGAVLARGPAVAASTVKTATIAGVTVLTNSTGFTLYSFAPDTPTTSKCNGTCAQNWPPLKGPVTAAGVTGTFGTIKRSDGSTQATFDGHPLYTFVGDTAPGQAKGNGLNAAGGLWHEITTSGTAAPAPAAGSSSSSGGGGSGY